VGIFDDLFADADLKQKIEQFGVHKAGDIAVDAMWETEDERLDHENKQLDAYIKRKSLGLPMDSQDLEDAMNDDMSFRSKGVLAAFGRKASQMIPDPSFLKPKLSGNLPPTFFKIGTKVGEMDDWPSIARGVLGVLTKRRA
jgi:hypothetical protein